LQDLVKISFIGEGGFSKVYLVANPKDSKFYALKVIDKAGIVKHKMEEAIVNVVGIMKQLSYPFILSLHQTFKDEFRIYFLEEFVQGAVMFDFLKSTGILSNQQTQFYVGQILLALEYMHTQNIIYRDLKPENIMVG
jgi:cGMP-dependent protein kinase